MIKPLRKRHLQIWSLLAVLLPLGIISAWLAIPGTAYDKLMQPTAGHALPVIVKSYKKTDFTINIRTNMDHSSWQLEWTNNSALTTPSALIYQKQNDVADSIKDSDLIGRIDARGTYYFSLKNTDKAEGFHFIIYDIIHHRVIEKINL